MKTFNELASIEKKAKERGVRFKVEYKDFEIINTWNSDGYVVITHNPKHFENEVSKTVGYRHCGGHLTLGDAYDAINKMSKVTYSYWEDNGTFQTELGYLTKTLMPSRGAADSFEGELVRIVNKFYYEYCNNGNCNAASRPIEEVEETCWECGGDGEIDSPEEETGQANDAQECDYCSGEGVIVEEEYGEYEMDEWYDSFLEFVENHVPDSAEACEKVRMLICDDRLHYKYKYDQREYDVYNEFTNIIMSYVAGRLLKREGRTTPLREIDQKHYDKFFDFPLTVDEATENPKIRYEIDKIDSTHFRSRVQNTERWSQSFHKDQWIDSWTGKDLIFNNK